MNKRIAKKIVKSYEGGKTTYAPWATLVKAFNRLGKNPPELVKESVEAVEESVKEAVEAVKESVVQVREVVDLTKMKVSELKTLAKGRGIKGISKMKKADLIEALA